MEDFAAGGAWPGAVAVSGGGDSLALMHLLARWAKKAKATAPAVLIVDHGLRPESKKEALNVSRKARKLGLKATVLRWTGPHPKKGIEAEARQARYRLMGAWLKKRKLTTLYVGHHEDDQAETFLLRLARGSGLDGLSAMRPLARYPHSDFRGLTLARPLLGTPRADLRAYLAALGEDWIDDPMNDDPRFDRVKMRKLAPALAEVGLTPARIALAATHLASARDLLEGLTLILLDRASRSVAGGVLIDTVALGGAPRELGLRALAALLQQVSGVPYRPRFDALQRLFDRFVTGGLGGGATLSGCVLRPAPAGERVFGPATLKLTPEKARKNPGKARQSSAKIARQNPVKVARGRQTA
ncbi:MAG TPA: tRNA lysidine(34) synthetase TilS [Rhizomicrobium sp.]|nr:tRNA lysidine(34) synthetase TilS [Rhizomicrobium sp.]